MQGAKNIDDVDGVLSVEKENALIVTVGILVDERDITEAYSEDDWEEKSVRGRLVSLNAREEMSEACSGEEKTCRTDKATRAAMLMALNAGNCLAKMKQLEMQQ